ncbi:MAG: phosphate acyltransferase PlsX [Chromatiales bacterium]|jgi:glycerol-3-phosphate acyltransferase PlsX|nr:MAG: phosphate acyltransferase PlsX [Chromatiales bacterium]
MVTVALDAMGGDFAPAEPVAGAAMASMDERGPHLLLVGDVGRIQAELKKHEHTPGRFSFEAAQEAVPMDATPREALDRLPDASISVAARAVCAGKADALVSAGNTGALILSCSTIWNRLEGVRRCALAAVFPTERRRGENQDPFSLILDVGATLEASAQDLVAFAVMGSAYAARISRNPQPLVALLSSGSEPGKGRPEIVAAHQLLKLNRAITFIGNVEGVDLPHGRADVIVTDGFTGNVVLKMLEGVSETVMNIGRYAYRSSIFWRAGLMFLGSGIRQLRQLTDWQEYGGAPVLGFDHVCIKAHGRSGRRAIANAIRVANKAVRTEVVAAMREGLARAHELDSPDQSPAREA